MERILTYQKVRDIATTLTPVREFIKPACAVIWQAEREYHFSLRAQKQNGSFQNHERRMKSIELAASKMLSLVREEPLIHQILAEKILLDDPITTDSLEKADQAVADQVRYDEGELIRILQRTLGGAANLANNPDELRAARFDADRKDAHKSMERRLIWTPIMYFCVCHEIKLSFYENGRLFKCLSMLHEGLGIDPLKAGSLRRAIEEYVHEPSVLDEGDILEWHVEP